MTDRSGHTYDGAGVLDAATAPGAAPRGRRGRRHRHRAPASARSPVSRTTTDDTTLGPGRTRRWPSSSAGVGNGVPHEARRSRACSAGSVIGTYLHGPVLARNPALADHLLTLAAGRPLTPLDLPDQDAVRRTYLTTPRRRGSGHRRQ